MPLPDPPPYAMSSILSPKRLLLLVLSIVGLCGVVAAGFLVAPTPHTLYVDGEAQIVSGSFATVADVLARLSYEDNEGRHIYYMKKDQILIGRRDESTSHLDVALATRPDVSREHLRIRHDAQSGTFALQDLSQYGASVNGRRVPVPSGSVEDARPAWHPLPSVAEIGLADIVFIHFEALTP